MPTGFDMQCPFLALFHHEGLGRVSCASRADDLPSGSEYCVRTGGAVRLEEDARCGKAQTWWVFLQCEASHLRSPIKIKDLVRLRGSKNLARPSEMTGKCLNLLTLCNLDSGFMDVRLPTTSKFYDS